MFPLVWILSLWSGLYSGLALLSTLSFALSLGQVVTPVPDVEHEKSKWKDPTGKDVNLLRLELEVVDPRGDGISLPCWRPVPWIG